LHRSLNLHRLSQDFARLGEFVQLAVSEAQSVQSAGILLIVLPLDQGSRSLEFRNRGRRLLLLQISPSDRVVRRARRKLVRLVGIRRVRLRNFVRLLRIAVAFAELPESP